MTISVERPERSRSPSSSSGKKADRRADGDRRKPSNWQVTCLKKRMKQDDEGIRTYSVVSPRPKGTGPGSGGQSGDTQGLSDVAEAGSESVEELVEEGQSFEAEVISGVEDAPEPDMAELHTKEVPEDDVPDQYLEKDQ